MTPLDHATLHRFSADLRSAFAARAAELLDWSHPELTVTANPLGDLFFLFELTHTASGQAAVARVIRYGAAEEFGTTIQPNTPTWSAEIVYLIRSAEEEFTEMLDNGLADQR